MSILLEALRKSEKNQQSPEAPDIHKDNESSNSPDPIQPGPLALLLILALFLSGWFVWNQFRPPEGGYQPPVTLAAGNTRPTTSEPQQQDVIEQETIQDQQTEADSDPSDSRPRTPVESYQEAIKSLSTAKTTTSPPKANPVKQNQLVAKQNEPVKQPPVVSEKPKEDSHLEPTPLTYWELPDSVRANVPVIKFSVLVYAKREEDRFVLINGQRLAEGDAVQPGLLVNEIRRDGVVFSYRMYEFLVER